MSENSPSSAKCPTCGEVLPQKNSGGCPVCLMKVAMSDTLPTSPMTAPQRAPTLEELAPLFPQLDLLEFIGRGGMGLVYKARQKSLNRLVALKLLAPAHEHEKAFAERFEIEARALAALDHPNIVTVYDSGKTAGFCYLLMEFMDGVNLRQAMRAERLTPEQALAIVPPICEALQYAHERGIVHRDIKPENLLMNKEGKVKIADFGIAKMISEPDTAMPANGGEMRDAKITFAGGTPQYMAPEQKRRSSGTDHRVDIYSLGVVLYELLTGELPEANLQAPSYKVQVDVRLDQVVLRALAKSPELRFQSAGEMRTQLATVMQPSESSESAPAAPARKGLLALMTPLRVFLGAAFIMLLSVVAVAVAVRVFEQTPGPAAKRVASRVQMESPSPAPQPAPPQELRPVFAREGAHDLTRSYRPITLRLNAERPAEVSKMPEGVTSPLFGQARIGPMETPAKVTVMIEVLPNKGSRIWVDGNANGDLTDDPAPNWETRTGSTPAIPDLRSERGHAWVKLPYGAEAAETRMEIYMIGYSAAAPKVSTLIYYLDCIRKAQLTIDGVACMLIIKDSDGDGDFRTHPDFYASSGARNAEVRKLTVYDDPLRVQLEGHVYEVRNLPASGDRFDWIDTSLEISPSAVEERRSSSAMSSGQRRNTTGMSNGRRSSSPPPAYGQDHSSPTTTKFGLGKAGVISEPKSGPTIFAIGNAAPVFEATAIDGTRIQMPQSFKGKVLLLDFWATWCGPCVAQLPHLQDTYRKYQPLGLEILGISLDEDKSMRRLPAYLDTKNLNWPQICEGKGFSGLIPGKYRISAIPTTVLIDGDTGNILALNPKGEALEEAIRIAVAAKRAKPTL